MSPESTPPPPAREESPWPDFAKPTDSPSATDEVLDALPLPEDRHAFRQLLRASQRPDAFAATVKGLGPGGIEEAETRATWAEIGKALRDLAADGAKPNPAILRGFVRRAKQRAPAGATGNLSDDLGRYAAQLRAEEAPAA